MREEWGFFPWGTVSTNGAWGEHLPWGTQRLLQRRQNRLLPILPPLPTPLFPPAPPLSLFSITSLCNGAERHPNTSRLNPEVWEKSPREGGFVEGENVGQVTHVIEGNVTFTVVHKHPHTLGSFPKG